MVMLPDLPLGKWRPTRDTLREVCLILSTLQRAYLPAHPRQWQYGLEVNLRGLSTQEFMFKGQPLRATLDLVRHKVRLAGEKWSLRENPPALIAENIQEWLAGQGEKVALDLPEFVAGTVEYDQSQADSYAGALWWFDEQFRSVKEGLKQGITQPILLYPHHFDLSLVWFPWDDERQIGLGWSTGDEHVKEAYLYLTAYPEPTGFTKLGLTKNAYWQKAGFSGAVLPYKNLHLSSDPAGLFKEFAAIMLQAKNLFG